MSKSSPSNPSDTLASALAALNDALDRLDGAVDSHIESGATVRSTDEEVQRMAGDRARLARDLDESEARAQNLAGVNGEVSRRLVDVMETVRDVIDAPAGK